jgi:hypothetical protein
VKKERLKWVASDIAGISGIFGRAFYVSETWSTKQARVGEPTEEWNEKHERPEEFFEERCPAVNDPHANDKGDTDPKAESDE